jgi:hypothetical protein
VHLCKVQTQLGVTQIMLYYYSSSISGRPRIVIEYYAVDKYVLLCLNISVSLKQIYKMPKVSE